jgi:hypothetical protein
VNPWAAGIVHALDTVNLLFDKTQEPHIRAGDLAEAVGPAKNTINGKSKQTWDLLKIEPIHRDWALLGRMDNNLIAWMVSVDGLVLHARYLPRQIQEEAYRLGLIPYVPDRRG